MKRFLFSCILSLLLLGGTAWGGDGDYHIDEVTVDGTTWEMGLAGLNTEIALDQTYDVVMDVSFDAGGLYTDDYTDGISAAIYFPAIIDRTLAWSESASSPDLKNPPGPGVPDHAEWTLQGPFMVSSADVNPDWVPRIAVAELKVYNSDELLVLDGRVGQLVKTPEPATLLLLGTGLIGFIGLGRRKIFKK